MGLGLNKMSPRASKMGIWERFRRKPQYGTPPTALATSVARLDDGTTARPIGELVDEIIKDTKAIQSRSAGVEDAEVSRTVR